jgi:hypothetical protein
MEAARLLADALFLRDPYFVKHYRVLSRYVPYRERNTLKDDAVITTEPVYMGLEEQRELFAQRIRALAQYQFLLRPAESEGTISTNVYPISIRIVGLNRETDAYDYPERDLMDRLCSALAAKSGMPVTRLLAEQDAWLIQGTSQKPQQTQPAKEAGERLTSRRSDHTHLEPGKAKPTPSPPNP